MPEFTGNRFFAGIRFDLALPQAPVDATCDAVGWGAVTDGLGTSELRLSCDLGIEESLDLQIVFGNDVFDPQLQSWADLEALQLSFRTEGNGLKEAVLSLNTRTITLRDATGRMLLMSLKQSIPAPVRGEELETAEISGPYWLPEGSEEREAWNDPFGEMQVRDIGCAQRDGTRQPSWSSTRLKTETPWVVEFTSDEGEQQLFDQSSAVVAIDGQRFDVHVNHAFTSADTGSTFLSSTSGLELLFVRSD